MEQTSTPSAQWRLILIGLVAGPALLVASSVFIVPEAPGGMRATFDAMAGHPWLLLVQSVVEALGFVVTLAAFAASTRIVRRSGGVLSTTGAVLCVIGTLGFTWSAAGGMFLSALARMGDRDAGYAAAMAMIGDPVSGGVIAAFMNAGEAGLLLVLLGFWRAGLGIWPFALAAGGVVADLVLPGMYSGLVADVLLLAAAVWTTVRLRGANTAASGISEVPSPAVDAYL